MLVRLLARISLKWALFYANHMTGQHVSPSWLRNNGYGR